MATKPAAFQLFHMYYLGLTPEFTTKFYNINSVARHFNASPGEVEEWLREYHIHPDIFSRIRFNVAEAHGKAQEVGLFGSPDEAREFARTTFQEAMDSLSTYDEKNYFEDIDYDDIWGEKDK